jgi:DNA-binding CsgD family transcriptional regulator
MRVLTPADRAAAERATDRELAVVAAVVAAGSEKAAAHRLGLSHSTVKHHLANARSKVGATTTAQLVWILGLRLPEPESAISLDEQGDTRPQVPSGNRPARSLGP